MDVRNYTEENILQIKKYIESKANVINESISWVDNHLKYEDKNFVLLKLKSAQNKFKKITSSIDSKPVMAVFGASQVGKSYLIKNLLSIKGQPFLINNNNNNFDFLKDINPPGTGAESTGVVTRFTVDNHIKFSEFPITIKLLSAKDILIIILDSFFLDLMKINSPIINNRRDVEAHIKRFELAKETSKQNFLNEYDVLEIKEYFENHLSKHTILFEGLSETRFFERIGKIIECYEYSEWNQIFNILWNKNEDLSSLFISLITELNNLDYVEKGYISFDNVLRGYGEILDVKRLKEIGISTNKTVLKKENGEEKHIEVSYLSALISELIFSIPQELMDSKMFLKNSDLLDFPGARSRLGIEVEGIHKNVHEMLLRGKVSYLFNKYTDDYSINNLLFCTNDKQLEVNELSYLLFNWISKNIGLSIDERTKSLGNLSVPPLFLIYTFFNNQLKYDTTNDDGFLSIDDKLDYKWNTRFVRFFENEIVTKVRDWHTQWTHVSKEFKNFYLLRDFKYSTDTFDGFELQGYETNIKEERVEFFNALKKSFLNYNFVQKHFYNPEESWNMSTSKNEDGSELIIQNLEKVSSNYSKINHYLNLLASTILEISDLLKKYIKTDNVTEQKNKNMTLSSALQFQFNLALSKDMSLYNDFIEKLSIKPVDIYNLLNENRYVDTSTIDQKESTPASILLTTYPELHNATTYEEALNVLKLKMMLPSTKDVESLLSDNGIKKEEIFIKKNSLSKSEYYTDLVLSFWTKKIKEASCFNEFTSMGISINNIDFLTDHLLVLIKKREVKQKLIKILDEVISEINHNQNNEAFLAETFALIINDFVYNFDIHYLSEEERTELKNVINNYSNSYFDKKSLQDSDTIATLFDNTNLDVKTIALEKYNRWIEFLKLSLLVNSGFVNYDEGANEELKSIVNQYDNLKLN